MTDDTKEIDNVIDFEQKSIEKHLENGGGILRAMKINESGELEEVGVKKLQSFGNPGDLMKEIASVILGDLTGRKESQTEPPVYDEEQYKKLSGILTEYFKDVDFESHKFDFEKRFQYHVTLAWTKLAAFFVRRTPKDFDNFKNPHRSHLEKEDVIRLVSYEMIQGIYCDVYRFYKVEGITLPELIDSYCKWFICKHNTIKEECSKKQEKPMIMLCVEDTVKNIIDDHSVIPSELAYILISTDISIDEFIEGFGI